MCLKVYDVDLDIGILGISVIIEMGIDNLLFRFKM